MFLQSRAKHFLNSLGSGLLLGSPRQLDSLLSSFRIARSLESVFACLVKIESLFGAGAMWAEFGCADIYGAGTWMRLRENNTTTRRVARSQSKSIPCICESDLEFNM
jgi:hypothetical protein